MSSRPYMCVAFQRAAAESQYRPNQANVQDNRFWQSRSSRSRNADSWPVRAVLSAPPENFSRNGRYAARSARSNRVIYSACLRLTLCVALCARKHDHRRRSEDCNGGAEEVECGAGLEDSMSTGLAMLVFVACLALMLVATDSLVRGLDHLGVRVGLSEGLLGLLTALGADAPEVSSAMAALQSGHHAIGLGVVLGSNLFNLAALLGLGAVLAGHIHVKRASLILDGGVGLLVTILVAVMILHLLAQAICAVLLVLVLVPYLGVLAMSPWRLASLHLPDRWSSRLAVAVTAIDQESAQDPRVSRASATWRPSPGDSRGSCHRRWQCRPGAVCGHLGDCLADPGFSGWHASVGEPHQRAECLCRRPARATGLRRRPRERDV
jgi:hypothetical protein